MEERATGENSEINIQNNHFVQPSSYLDDIVLKIFVELHLKMLYYKNKSSKKII